MVIIYVVALLKVHGFPDWSQVRYKSLWFSKLGCWILDLNSIQEHICEISLGGKFALYQRDELGFSYKIRDIYVWFRMQYHKVRATLLVS